MAWMIFISATVVAIAVGLLVIKLFDPFTPKEQQVTEGCIVAFQIGLTNAVGRIEELEKWKRDVELQLSRAKERQPNTMNPRGFTGWKRHQELLAQEQPIVPNRE